MYLISVNIIKSCSDNAVLCFQVIQIRSLESCKCIFTCSEKSSSHDYGVILHKPGLRTANTGTLVNTIANTAWQL